MKKPESLSGQLDKLKNLSDSERIKDVAEAKRKKEKEAEDKRKWEEEKEEAEKKRRWEEKKKEEAEDKRKWEEVEKKAEEKRKREKEAETKRIETEKKIKHYTLIVSVILSLIPTIFYSVHYGLTPIFEVPKILVVIVVLIGFIFPPAFFLFSLPALLLLFLICYGLIPALIGTAAFLVLYLPILSIVKNLTK